MQMSVPWLPIKTLFPRLQLAIFFTAMKEIPQLQKYVLCVFFLSRILHYSLGFESYEYYAYEAEGSLRSRRSVAIYNPPQPSPEFPAILFSDLYFNNDTSSGYIHRLRPGEFRVWGRTVADRKRKFVFRSMLFMPDVEITFKACCLTGNSWTSPITKVSNISNIHIWMFDNQEVGGSSGIFYTSWEQWMMDFSIRVNCPVRGCQPVSCGRTCYFGTCGIGGECQCTNGHSGTECKTKPAPNEPYPTHLHPLLLFPEKNFQGTPEKFAADKMAEFASNRQKQKTMKYNSLRVLYTRPLIFSRIDHSVTSKVAIGSDIEDLQGYMEANPDVANVLWFNYASDIDLKFGVKVEDVPACRNCSLTHGSCYTGTCVCMDGYSGSDCDISP